MYLKIIIISNILGMIGLSNVKSQDELSFLEVSSIFDMISSVGSPSNGSSNSNGSGTASGCMGRYGNCFYYKGCNLTQQQYAGLLLSPITDFIVHTATPCAQANGSGLLAFDPTTGALIFNFNIGNVSAYPRHDDAYCNCTVCNQTCGDVFVNRCNNTETCPSQKYQMLSPSTTIPILGGSGSFCLSSSNTTKCSSLIFCNIQYDFLGSAIDLGDFQFFCAQGDLDLSTENNSLTFGLSNVQITIPSSSSCGICNCTSCAGPCADNPLLGCLNNKTNCPHDGGKYCSTTEKQHCEE